MELIIDENEKKCSLCSRIARKKQQYCVFHHNEYMRNWRKTHPLKDEQKKKSNARAYARIYEKRGKIKRKPCEICGKTTVQRHHLDYDNPLNIVYLCKDCHANQHKSI